MKTAKQDYDLKRTEAMTLLNQITNLIRNHSATVDSINYSHVGSLAHVVEELKGINEFMGGPPNILDTPTLYPSINELSLLTFALRQFVNNHSASYGADAAAMLKVLDSWAGQPKMIELTLLNKETIRLALVKAIRAASFKGTKDGYQQLLKKVEELKP